MAKKISNLRNEYRCCIEMNQNGKYCVRIRVQFTRHEWLLPVYFMASTFDRSIRKLEQVLQFLQRSEDRLWFWGVNRSDDPMFSEEMLREAGLRLDRRGEFPRRTESVIVPPEQPVPAFLLAPMRRGLAELVAAGASRTGASRAAAS
jgi:hypothetical protein